MKFTAEIDCGNAAFDDAPASELAQVLRRIAAYIEEGRTGSAVVDFNGNTVGKWEVRS